MKWEINIYKEISFNKEVKLHLLNQLLDSKIYSKTESTSLLAYEKAEQMQWKKARITEIYT